VTHTHTVSNFETLFTYLYVYEKQYMIKLYKYTNIDKYES